MGIIPFGRVQGQRPCRVWAEPSVTPVTLRARTQETCVEKAFFMKDHSCVSMRARH